MMNLIMNGDKMDDDITYAVEFGNKIYTYKHRSTVEFCTDI